MMRSFAHRTQSVPPTSAEHARRHIAVRLLPFLFLLYIINYLDRTSVAYAAIGMARDLGFDDRVFGLGVGVFFLSYVALQIPGAVLAQRWSARGTICASMNGASKSNSLFTFPDSTSVPANGWILTLICLAKTVFQY